MDVYVAFGQLVFALAEDVTQDGELFLGGKPCSESATGIEEDKTAT